MLPEQTHWWTPLAGVPTNAVSWSGGNLSEGRPRSSSNTGQPQCQVEGCSAVLSHEEKVYCLKKRICSYHMRAEHILLPGDLTQPWRFCFQCGKLEPLSQFDGTKRSCRAMLQRRKLPPRRSQSWTAGSHSSSTTAFMPVQQQLHLLQQPQPHLLQQHQMLLLEAQHQQLQQASTMLSADPAAAAAAAAAAATSSGAASLSIQQRQQLLMQQLQQVHAAMAQLGGVAGHNSPSSSIAPHSLAGLANPAGCASAATPSFGGSSPACNNNGDSTVGSAHLSVTADSLAHAVQQAPAPGSSMFRQAFSVAFTEHTASAAPGLSPEVMRVPGQQLQAQEQSVAPTAAAAAAALAGSCGWPYDGSAAAPAATASRAAPAAAHARVKRHKSLSALLARREGPEEDLQEDDLFLDMDVCDELDQFATPSNLYQSEGDAFMDELAAAFGDRTEADPGTAVSAPGTTAVPPQHQQQQQWELPQQVWPSQPPQAPPAVHEIGLPPHFTAGMPTPHLPYSNGCMQLGTVDGLGSAHAGWANLAAAGVSTAAGQPSVTAQGGMQGEVTEQHELQLQQLMQSIQVLQDSVQQLSMHIHQGGPAAAPAATAGSAGNPGCADGLYGMYGMPGHPSM